MTDTGGGRFDPDEEFVFFLAGTSIPGAADYHPWTLIGVDSVLTGHGLEELGERIADPGGKLMLDSGVFWLASRHAEVHGLDFYEALTLAPENLTDYDRLLERYVELVKEYETDLWGYVEIDQGGPDAKRRTRAALEAQGLRPIPVYHPLTDGFDYLDELLEGYDRICVGNVVLSDAATRRGLLGMVWERRRRCGRKVWLHALGYTPNPLLLAYPFNSADSSSHVASLRFGQSTGRAMLAPFGLLNDPGYRYATDLFEDPERGRPKAVAVLAWNARTEVEQWRRERADFARVLDAPRWPAAYENESEPVGVR